MKKTITVSIGGNNYRLLSAENEEYTQKVADHVDGMIQDLLSQGNISIIDAAVLTSVNLADEYFKPSSVKKSSVFSLCISPDRIKGIAPP